MTTLLDQLCQHWTEDDPPDLPQMIAEHGEISVSDLSVLVSEDHRFHRLAGGDRLVEFYLDEFPQLRDAAECMDLVYNEFILREEAGEAPELSEYLERFPDLQESIKRQFQVHKLLLQQGEQEAQKSLDSLVREDSGKHPHVEGFDLIEVVGHGAMGIVYKAHDLKLNRTVAIKMLLAGQHSSEKQREQLRRESASAASLRHAGIVAVHQVGMTPQGIPFLVMEYVDGGTLADVLAIGPMDSAEAVSIALQVSTAIAYAHERQLVHRDLKPANILAGPNGPLVADFGLSKRIDATLTAANLSSVVGTPQYMAPEQTDATAPIGPAVDVYSIGAVLYEMLAGRPPLQGASPWDVLEQLRTHDPPRLRELNPSIPKDLETICQKCLQKEPLRRFPTAGELCEDLRRYSEGRPIASRPVGVLDRAMRWCRREPKLAIFGATTALMTAVLLVVSTVAAVRVGDAESETRAIQTVATEAKVLALLNAAPDAIPLCIDQLDHEAPATVAMLDQQLGSDVEVEPAIRFRAACGLAATGDVRATAILDAFGLVPPSRGVTRSAVRALQSVAQQVESDLAWRSQQAQPDTAVRFACLAMFLGDLGPATRLTVPAANPTPRTLFIHSFQNWMGDEAAVPKIMGMADANLAAAVCLGIGNIDPLTLQRDAREKIVQVMLRLYRESDNGAVHSAAGWAMRSWGREVPLVSGNYAGWEVNSFGITMIQVAPGRLTMGSRDDEETLHEATITRGFMMSDREINCGLMARFADAQQSDEEREQLVPTANVSPSSQHPAQSVSWWNAVRFCNWLSEQEGRKLCYTQTEELREGELTKIWTCDFAAGGYRLPTEAEWELACRSRSAARYSFGDDQQLEPRYARSSNARMIPALPCGSLMPNAFGFFDMHGNVWEFCWDEGVAPVNTPQIDPLGASGRTAAEGTRRLIRGGGISNASGDSDADARGWQGTGFRSWNAGLRVVRTQQPG